MPARTESDKRRPRYSSPVRLHVVSGKGGTGKTTVACAMALAMAARGMKVLLVEIEGRQGISQAFDVAPLGPEERTIVSDPSGGEVVGLAVDAKSALLEYLHKFYKLGRAGSVLEKVGAVDFATTIAPGVRDVLLVGKVYEAVGRTARSKGSTYPVYDAVVLDAPPTGRIAKVLGVNAEVSEVAKVGPIRKQADSITDLLRSPRTEVHLVTLLEEMPVQETVDAVAELTEQSLRVGSVIVNMVHDLHLGSDEEAALAEGFTDEGVRDNLRHGLELGGINPTEAMVHGLLTEGRNHLERTRLQQEQEDVLQGIDLPLRRLPRLADGIESGGLTVLAQILDEEGMFA